MKNLYMTFALLCTITLASAQWNSDTLANLQVANLSVTGTLALGTDDGLTYVTFYSNVEDKYFIRVQLLDANGNKLFGDSGILVSELGASADTNYYICLDTGNNLIVGLQYDNAGVTTAIINKITLFGDRPWGFTGVELGPGFFTFPVCLTDGEIVAAWNNGSVISYQKIHPDGSLSWSLPKVISASLDSVADPALVAHTNNTFLIVYQQSFDATDLTRLFAQRFDSAGSPIWVGPVQLSDYSTGLFHFYGKMLADGDRTYMCYFGNPPGQSRYDGFVQKIEPDGALPWGINGGRFADYSTTSEPSVRRVEITWDSGSSVIWAIGLMADSAQEIFGTYIQKFDVATGSRLLGNNAKIVFPVDTISTREVADFHLCDGEPLFVFFDDSRKLYATRLNDLGDFAWVPAKREIGSSTRQKRSFSFTKIVNDQAVAVWQENRGGGTILPYAQNIRCDGSTGVLLPVSLTKFWGSLTGKVVSLFWETKTENNNRGFYVSRSMDGINFSNIGFVASKALSGNSVGTINYTSADAKPFIGNNYYRLEQQDFDGRSTHSNVILIKNSNSFTMRVNSVYPNPVLNVLNIYIEASVTDKARFIISDVTGKIVYQQTADIRKGSNNFQADITGLRPGSYFIKLLSRNFYDNAQQPFIKR